MKLMEWSAVIASCLSDYYNMCQTTKKIGIHQWSHWQMNTMCRRMGQLELIHFPKYYPEKSHQVRWVKLWMNVNLHEFLRLILEECGKDSCIRCMQVIPPRTDDWRQHHCDIKTTTKKIWDVNLRTKLDKFATLTAPKVLFRSDYAEQVVGRYYKKFLIRWVVHEMSRKSLHAQFSCTRI